jgi:hypothetical protein
MALRFIVRPFAEADIDSAAQWYESERQGLAARFLTDLDRAFTRIEECPIQFPAIAGGTRRALLHTFPPPCTFRRRIPVYLAVNGLAKPNCDANCVVPPNRMSCDLLSARVGPSIATQPFAKRPDEPPRSGQREPETPSSVKPDDAGKPERIRRMPSTGAGTHGRFRPRPPTRRW